MAHDPHHESIIESINEIFTRYSELEDRLKFLENELEAFDDRNVVANILENYRAEFNGGYKHLRQHCVAHQEGGIGCPDCYDFICDACGEHKEGKPEEVVNTETLCGVVVCRDCYTSRDFDTKCTNDACPICGGNTSERIDVQAEWMEKKIARQKEVDKMVGQVKAAATKAVHEVTEQHKEAFEKLVEKRRVK